MTTTTMAEDVSLGTFETEIEQTSDTLEILEQIALVQQQQLEHQRSQLLSETRGVFFALAVSVAVIVAGVAPLVEASSDDRRLILIWTAVVCVDRRARLRRGPRRSVAHRLTPLAHWVRALRGAGSIGRRSSALYKASVRFMMLSVPRISDEQREATRGRLIDAAISVTLTKGNGSPTTREILAEAGLSAGALYHYFESKDELSEAIAQRFVDQDWANQILPDDACTEDAIEHHAAVVHELFAERHHADPRQAPRFVARERTGAGDHGPPR